MVIGVHAAICEAKRSVMHDQHDEPSIGYAPMNSRPAAGSMHLQ